MNSSNRFYDDEYEEREERRNRRGPRRMREAPPSKQSYESSVEVQRWLAEQRLRKRMRPPFDPAFLSERRDRDWIISSLEHFYERELIDDVLYEARSGKEATVFCCVAGPRADGLLAAKVYRPRMFRSLRNDAIYRLNRTQRDRSGAVLRGTRLERDNSRPEDRVAAWIGYEFVTQELLYAAGARVPRPLAQAGNAVLMEFIGDTEASAPLLHQVVPEQAEAQLLYKQVLATVTIFLRCHRIHGDLSDYNILYRPGEAVVIDLAQAVDPRQGGDVFPLLKRDVERVCAFFARHGVTSDASAIAIDLWERYLAGEL